MHYIRRGLCWMAWLLVLVTSSANADELMSSVQQKLKSLGYYEGEVDGIYGSQTAAAIRRYQYANKLRITGELNEQTLDHLGFQSLRDQAQKDEASKKRWSFFGEIP